ncbi:Tubulin-specific chaperone A [Balamuthia mandrillaris]
MPQTEQDKLLRQLKIKGGTCERLQKDLRAYEKEAQQVEAKLQQMRESGADAHDIKQQEMVLEETQTMIVDSKKRLEDALDALKKLIDEDLESSSIDLTALKESPEYEKATTILQQSISS